MNEKLVDTIAQLVQQGGTTALWIYGMSVATGIIKFAIGFGCMVIAVKRVCQTVKYGVDHAREK